MPLRIIIPCVHFNFRFGYFYYRINECYLICFMSLNHLLLLTKSVLSELEIENEELKKSIERLKEEQASKVAYLKKNVKEVESKTETVQQEYAEHKRVCTLT